MCCQIAWIESQKMPNPISNTHCRRPALAYGLRLLFIALFWHLSCWTSWLSQAVKTAKALPGTESDGNTWVSVATDVWSMDAPFSARSRAISSRFAHSAIYPSGITPSMFSSNSVPTNCLENGLHAEARVVSGQGIDSSEVLWGHRPRTCVA